MRAFFADSVQRCAELRLLASVGTVAQARAWLDDTSVQVDVLLTDLGLPDGRGLDLIGHARRRHPECEVMVISMFGDEDNVLASIEAGALGYIHKDATPDDIALAILALKAGGSPISPMIARRMLSNFSLRPPKQAPDIQGAGKNALSVREREVLELIARGFSYAEIARLKSLTIHTVQSHVKNLYTKLAVHSKSEAVYEATRMGWLSQDSGERGNP